MSASVSFAPREDAEGLSSSPVIAPAKVESAVLSRIDFAIVVDRQLLVYGWIIGFSTGLRTASLDLGGVLIDLLQTASPVKRPDVVEHFQLPAENQRHGFYALVDLPVKFSLVDDLKLYVTLVSGEAAESRWSVSCHDAPAAPVLEPFVQTLRRLLPHLSKLEAKRLIDFAHPALGQFAPKHYLSSLPPPAGFEVDLCCILEGRVLVVSGWRLDPLKEMTSVELRAGDSVFRFLEDSVSFSRPDINPELSIYRERNQPQLAGFIFAHAVPPQDADQEQVRFVFDAGGEAVQLTYPIRHVPHAARRSLLSLLDKMESDSALVLIEHVARILGNGLDQSSLIALLALVRNRAIERLPPSIQNVHPRYSLHIDQAFPVADKGIFLMGWFNAESPASIKVACHCGSSVVVVSDNWSRHTRTDVTYHLAGLGFQAPHHEHGFSCYVPIDHSDAPCLLSASAEAGGVRRMRITLAEKPESALQTVRSLVTSFNQGNPELRSLLDGHIGPAVQSAWAARRISHPTPTVRSFGPQPTNPLISILVPLYGRHDFAAYQLALFADDPDFRGVELIYVVDDPTILAEFSRSCVDLYGIYKIPFVMASVGLNLGFAGANNFAAELARGHSLLFMNSDVLPKRAGWVSDLSKTYNSVADPGLLGAKLLYEDGSVQHAGMAFRRYPGWGDLWINDHPLKGQSPLGLDGIREVDAVTAACALIDASLFRGLGGFSEDYIIGDFEDSDLCLRLSAAGRRNYISLDVELYHLERQSQNRLDDVNWRNNLTLYNCWLHNSRWGQLIQQRAEQALSAVGQAV